MSTFHSFFVRVPPAALPDQAIRAVAYQLLMSATRGTFQLRLYAGSPWVEVQCPSYASMWGPARAISGRLATDVLAIAVQGSADVMELRFARNGRDEREILYSRDAGGWIASRGAPQPWETAAFFPDAAGNVALAVAGAADTLQVGSDLPLLDARSALESIARALDLPGLRADSPLPEAVRKVRATPALDLFSLVLLGAGLVLMTALGNELVGPWGLAGLPLGWGGFALRYRRASRLVSVGGGLLAAGALLLVAFFAGRLLR